MDDPVKFSLESSDLARLFEAILRWVALSVKSFAAAFVLYSDRQKL